MENNNNNNTPSNSPTPSGDAETRMKEQFKTLVNVIKKYNLNKLSNAEFLTFLRDEAKISVKHFEEEGVHTVETLPGFYFFKRYFSGENCKRLSKLCYDLGVNSHLYYNNISATAGVAAPSLRPKEDSTSSANNKLDKLKWITLGYNYDWTNRIYVEGWKSDFPDEIIQVIHKILRDVQVPSFACYKPEAAIVNYYARDTRMGLHRDDAELTFKAPIVSISLGRSCVFCIESPKEGAVLESFLVEDGDVVIMGGETRCSLHGVPGLLSEGVAQSGKQRDAVDEFLTNRRININVRQVEGSEMEETFSGRRLLKKNKVE